MAAMRRTSTGRTLVSPRRDHLALLNDAQELDLHRRRDLADFIQKERAAVRGLEDAQAVLHRPREGAPRVSEEFALEQRVGEGAAVDGDKGPLRPRRRLVQPARESLFADAALAGNQDRGIEGRHARREGHHVAHRGTLRAVLASRRYVRGRGEGCGEDLEARGEETEDAGVIIGRHENLTFGDTVEQGISTRVREPPEHGKRVAGKICDGRSQREKIEALTTVPAI